MRYSDEWHAWSAIGNAAAVDDGGTTSLLALFNAAATEWEIHVTRILLMSGSLTAVTGVGIQVSVRRISALSAGTACLLRPMNSGVLKGAQGDIATHVSAKTGGTTTAVETIAYRNANNDEIALTGQNDIAERVIWTPPHPDFGLVLNDKEGVDIYQVTASTAGGWTPQIDFLARRRR